jgi:hypothetical protein
MKYEKLEITSMVTGVTIKFMAYITDMTQTFSSTWNTEDVFGRSDPIALFQGTKRSISLALDVPSANAEEAKSNLATCGILSTFLYPGYTQDHQYDRYAQDSYPGDFTSTENLNLEQRNGYPGSYLNAAPLVKIKFANLIDGMSGAIEDEAAIGEASSRGSSEKGLLGYIDSYTFTPVMETGMFVKTRLLYPKTITISLNFNVLHQVTLGNKTVAFSEGRMIRSGDYPEEDDKDKITKEIETIWLAKKLPFS